MDFSPEAQGLATRRDDLSARAIVGPKGTGKTVYLRRLQAFASDQDELYADEIQQDLPQTEDIVKICQWYPEPVLTEKWAEIWKRAILRSLLTHLLFAKRLSGHVDEEQEVALREALTYFFEWKPRRPLSIYSQLREIINLFNTPQKLDAYLRKPLWEELEYDLAETIKGCPPICFYLDAIDDSFAHAPMYWLRCQKGLFYRVMHFLRDSRMGGRLHIVVCVRDVVYSSVLRSEHAMRYRGEGHIRVLQWDEPAIRHFLNAKLVTLSRDFFLGHTHEGPSVQAWLGREQIRNHNRGIDEPIDQYLLRHTRLIPRDIVTLGNVICNEIARVRHSSVSNTLTDGSLRVAVGRAARWFGDEQLQICANQVSTDMIPEKASRHGYTAFYTAGEEYARGVKDALIRIIQDVGRDVFEPTQVEEMAAVGRREFGDGTNIPEVLWQQRLLGFREKGMAPGRAMFYSISTMDQFHLPLGKEAYVLHPCLIDVAGIASTGQTPVIPY